MSANVKSGNAQVNESVNNSINFFNNNKLKKEVQMIKEQSISLTSMKVQIMEEKEDGSLIPRDDWRKFALISANRPIEDKNVYYFLQTIRAGKYNRRLPILTIEASKLIGQCEIVDFGGNPISTENMSEYLVVLDGQHRVKAFSLINDTKNESDEIVIIPNVQIEKEIGNVKEYLVDINTAGHDWTLGDKYCVSSITSNNRTIRKIHDYIKRGFNPSAAAMICTGRKITPTQLDKLLRNGDTSFISEKNEVVFLDRAEKFFVKGMSIDKMEIKILSKRYYVNGFTSFATSRTTEEAIKALEMLEIEDFDNIKDESEFIEKLRSMLLLEMQTA